MDFRNLAIALMLSGDFARLAKNEARRGAFPAYTRARHASLYGPTIYNQVTDAHVECFIEAATR